MRIYGGFRDAQGVSRIGYVDVDESDPCNVIAASREPVLDIGDPGMFDDNGVILGDIIEVNSEYWMYYVGFQHASKIKFLAFAGLAVSRDGGNTFQRKRVTPIMDRGENRPHICAIHTVLQEDETFRIWYAVGHGWQIIDGKSYPRYHIRTTTSHDGVTLSRDDGPVCLMPGDGEYRIGRPRVTRRFDGSYEMRFSFDTLDKRYGSGFAWSADGVHWERCDERLGLVPGPEAWDGESVCYPVVCETPKRTYCVYGGNGMGASGIGIATLEQN
ncbi:glucosyl hydrolase [Methylobacterium sp. J-030]|uniref:glucosyl hydrolase n=1 Tax=Methylobacterium sp. J-030 TaxID=2836627 RepID=UPI001FBA8B19|nr:glucosyl hydrolase [Methylobacterium sp. J-030]MCJ2073080.1 glucosyl hydrolase [Methylobacterium sp. J-030]